MEDSHLLCWEIKQCDEYSRRNCPAYNARKNCWEVNGTPIYSASAVACESCPVILSRIARAIAEAVGQPQSLRLQHSGLR